MPTPDLPPAIDTPLSVRGVSLLPSDDAQRLREKLARIVLDEMYQFVALLDTDGITLEVNRAALHGAGIRLEEIQGRPFWEARWWRVSPETQALQRDLIRRAAQGEFIRCDVEVYGEAAGEHTITIDYSLHPVRDQDGRIVFLLPEGRNITEKKRAEAEIRRLNQIKSDFFANVSHELRTPLALILGPLEGLLHAANLTEGQRRDVAVMQRNAGALLRHVNDLLDLARLDAGKTDLAYARVDLSRLVREAAAHFDTLATQRGLAFTIDTPPVLEAECDREKIERIVFNLLSNAFKFTPEGGRIQCTLTRRGHQAILAVRDNGPGVPPALRAEVFERFRQAQDGTTREFGGTGLGLAIAKDFAELHGGAVTLDEAPGGGALFEVTLPLSAPAGTGILAQPAPRDAPAPALVAQAEPLAALPQPAPDGRPLVLVAEDNPDMLRFIAGLLGEDYRVACAGDGAEALSRARAEPPDLLVTDLMMPSLGGDRLVDAMRQDPALAHVPVLVLSAIADEGLRLRLLSSLVQDYLVKPFSAQELRIRVRNLMMMKRTRDALQSELASQNEDLAQLAAK
ncbi:MAG TPA: ATP-binding protein, partial [Telluria sp.]|nr:ATP-binding protein [Telluria sp.]